MTNGGLTPRRPSPDNRDESTTFRDHKGSGTPQKENKMNNESRRRQMREMLKAKAKGIIEADRQRCLEKVKLLHESRRTMKGPYSPERFTEHVRDLFGGQERKAIIGK